MSSALVRTYHATGIPFRETDFIQLVVVVVVVVVPVASFPAGQLNFELDALGSTSVARAAAGEPRRPTNNDRKKTRLADRIRPKRHLARGPKNGQTNKQAPAGARHRRRRRRRHITGQILPSLTAAKEKV